MRMRRHSFFLKLLLGNLLLIGAIAVVAGIVSYRYLNANYRRQGELSQDRIAHLAREHFQDRWPLPPARIDAGCKRLFGDWAMRLTVIADDGRVLGDSQADPDRMVNHKTDDRPEVMAALAGRAAWHVRTSETLRREFRYLALPVRHEGKVPAVVRVAMPVRTILERGRFIPHALAWAALAAAVTAVGLGVLISWIWASPLGQVSRTAEEIASGNLQARARISGSKELARLAQALNRMRDSIDRQIALIEDQSENLQVVVGSLREGLVLLDASQRVILMNRAAAALLAPGADPQWAVGKHPQAVVRVAEVVDAVNELVATGRPVDRQLELEVAGRRRTLDLHAAGVGSGRREGARALLVVRDITDLARTVAMKAEFVANASHELRTPLATIRAAVESLGSVGPEDAEAFGKFLSILDRQVARLEEMTQDLLDLHRAETGRATFRPEPIALGTLAEWVRGAYSARAAEKGLSLEVCCGDPALEFTSTPALVQLVLQNLIDNGLKFTPSGGRVEVRLEPIDGRVRLAVADTGCGIPPDIQDRVFERFFQADPARSGGKGRGTGLGLAIVKHAVERLGGTVSLHSAVGEGTTVTVQLPLEPPP